jgi:hypothetical protein
MAHQTQASVARFNTEQAISRRSSPAPANGEHRRHDYVTPRKIPLGRRIVRMERRFRLSKQGFDTSVDERRSHLYFLVRKDCLYASSESEARVTSDLVCMGLTRRTRTAQPDSTSLTPIRILAAAARAHVRITRWTATRRSSHRSARITTTAERVARRVRCSIIARTSHRRASTGALRTTAGSRNEQRLCHGRRLAYR